jgi:hypothetical protein
MTTEPRPPSWAELLTLMVHGPDPEPAIRGTIHACGEDEGEGWLVLDEETCWLFERGNPVPEVAPRRALRYGGRGTALMARRSAEEFRGQGTPRRYADYLDPEDGDGTTRPGPIGTTTYLGRTAWTVELAPRRREPHPIALVVDAGTGIVLQQRDDGAGLVLEWTEFAAGEELDSALFTWQGPTRERVDPRRAREAEARDRDDRRRRWFAENVAHRPLRIELDVTPVLYEYDEATGAFSAGLGDQWPFGRLARRPRSASRWRLNWSGCRVHRWSTDRWDWALGFYEDRVTPADLEALKRHLDGEDA